MKVIGNEPKKQEKDISELTNEARVKNRMHKRRRNEIRNRKAIAQECSKFKKGTETVFLIFRYTFHINYETLHRNKFP
jgi:hypothetical protein